MLHIFSRHFLQNELMWAAIVDISQLIVAVGLFFSGNIGTGSE